MTRTVRRGFTMIELLVALVLLSGIVLGVLWMNRYSNRSSLDAYYELLANQLAEEPIEVFRAFGYAWLKTYESHPLAHLKTGRNPVTEPPGGGQHYPADCLAFEREITLTPVDKGDLRGIRVRVLVAPRAQSRVSRWLMRDEIAMEGLIMELPR